MKRLFLKVKKANMTTWYDNEMVYTHTLVEHVTKLGQSIK